MPFLQFQFLTLTDFRCLAYDALLLAGVEAHIKNVAMIGPCGTE